jgi:hypothetical protein
MIIRFKMVDDAPSQPGQPGKGTKAAKEALKLAEAKARDDKAKREVAKVEALRSACASEFKKKCEFGCKHQCKRRVERASLAEAKAKTKRSRAIKAGQRDPAIVPVEYEQVTTIDPYDGKRLRVNVTADSILGKAQRGYVKKEHIAPLSTYLQDYHLAFGVGGAAQFDMKVDGSGPGSQHHLHRIAAQNRVKGADAAMGQDYVLVCAYHCAGVSLNDLSSKSGVNKGIISHRINNALDALVNHYTPGVGRVDQLLRTCAEIVEKASREVA